LQGAAKECVDKSTIGFHGADNSLEYFWRMGGVPWHYKKAYGIDPTSTSSTRVTILSTKLGMSGYFKSSQRERRYTLAVASAY